MTDTMLAMRSTATDDGQLTLNLVEVPVPQPGDDEVLIRVEAAPINPSDLGMMFGVADVSTAQATLDGRGVEMRIPDGLMRAMSARLGQSLPVGNEGAGVVVATGSNADAKALDGRTVATLSGAMYAPYVVAKAAQCLPLPEGVSPEEGASCFVNPLTALGMVETMRLEQHSALIHTAAASNLGQMLNRICLADDVPLINIVRREGQAALLRDQGARHVVNSSDDGFFTDLVDAIDVTGATLAFDAIGGGKLVSQILTAMEASAAKRASEFNRYGSSVHKQVYIYGGLDRGPTVLNRSFGMTWGVGGWLLMPFLTRVGRDAADALRARVAREITTTFASHYDGEISLQQAVGLDAIAVYSKQATGHKYLVKPQT